jgi:DNA-binding beta-propeller fold protein YncE
MEMWRFPKREDQSMTRRISIARLGAMAGLLLALASDVPPGFAADPGAPLVLEKTIPLEDVAGRIDHMAIDLARHRLAVAELGNDTVDVINLDSGRAIGRIADLGEPQGVAFTADGDALVVANGDDGSVRFFRADDLAPIGRIDLGSDADNVRIDKNTGRLVVGYGAGGLAVIDPASRTKLADVPLPVHPEGFQLAPDGKRAHINLPDARQVAVVDLSAGKQVATWQMKDRRSNFPMAIDPAGTTLAIAFRGPPLLVLFDAATGAERASIGTCGDADDVFFDESRRRIYVSCGEGAVDVLGHSSGKVQRIAQVPTSSGARTALFAPEVDRLYVAVRAGLLGGDAKVLVFRPAP